jgi:hypothetical protein
MFKAFILAILMMLMMVSCVYRMPSDEDYSTVPTTNNPGIIRGSAEPSLMPGVKY